MANRRGNGITKTYTREELVEDQYTLRLNLKGIHEERSFRPMDGSMYRYVLCSVEGRYMGGCPHCGSINYYGNGSYPKNRLIHDVNIGMEGIDIELKMPRYLCNDCGKSFAPPIESIAGSQQLTKRLLEQIRFESFKMDHKAIAALHRCSPGTVSNVFEDYVKELEQKRQEAGVYAPRVLGIDEKHICNKMRGVLTNIETGEPLEMTEDNSGDTMRHAIESLIGYENIEIVTMDMANGYKKQIELALPQATIVIDKFHVIQDMSTKVRVIRKRLFETLKAQKGLSNEQYRLLNTASQDNYLFRYSDLAIRERPEKAKMMAELCQTFPEMNTLRRLKKGFEEIYLCSSREDAEATLSEWQDMVKKTDRSLFKEMYTLKNSMSYWEPYILNYFIPGCQFTNAVTEGVNSFTQRVNQMGNGYGFPALRAKVLYYHLVTEAPQYAFQKTVVDHQSRPSGSMGFYVPHIINDNKTIEEVVQVQRQPWEMESVSALNFAEPDSFLFLFGDNEDLFWPEEVSDDLTEDELAHESIENQMFGELEDAGDYYETLF